MPRYIDGYVIPVPKKTLAAYQQMSRKASRVWLENGALSFVEAVIDDLAPEGVVPFARAAKSKPGEVVVFSWIAFKSRTHRDKTNAKAMQDPRMASMMKSGAMPFDPGRMVYGGFKTFVDVDAKRR